MKGLGRQGAALRVPRVSMTRIWDVLKRHSDGWLAAGVAVALFLLYVITLAPAVLYGDSGELQLAAALGGIAHPTGYPLYLLLGWLWTHILPFGASPAYKLNLLSVLCAAAGAALAYLAGRRFLRVAGLNADAGLSAGGAVVGALLLGVSRTVWSQAIIAEVYALNLLLVVALIYTLLGWLERGRRWSDLIPLAVVFGLGLTHHRTIILFVPALILAIWAAERSARREASGERLQPAHILPLVGLALAPLLLYLYIPLRAPASPYVTIALEPAQPLRLYAGGVSGFLSFVLGRAFEGSVRPALLIQPARWSMALGLLNQQFTPIGITLGVAGLGALLLRRRWLAVWATLPAYVLLLAFNIVYDIGDVFVLFIPTYVVWTLWLSAGLVWLCKGVGDVVLRWKGSPARAGLTPLYRVLFQRMQQLAAWLVMLLAIVWLVVMTVKALPAVSRRHDLTAWAQWRQILVQDLPAGAVLVSNDRDDIMPMWYLQFVDGLRPDLIGLFPLIVDDGRWADIGMVVDRALGSGRPVYLIKPMPGLEVKLALEPAEAGMVRVMGLAQGCEAARPTGALLANRIRLAGFTRAPYSVAPGQELTVTLCWQPLFPLGRNYSSFVQLLDRAGNRIVGSDQQPGGDFYPTSLWKPGETLRDVHRLTVPADLAPGAYRLVAGLYLYPSLERLGDADLGFVGVKTKVETQRRPAPNPTEYFFEDKILLLGYELRKEGRSYLLSLEWEALNQMEHDYTTFVHLIDANGKIVSQADNQPIGGTYPTSIWDKGEIIFDAYRLPIEVDMPAGQYRLLIGLYRLETMQRLNIFDAGGKALGNFVVLQNVTWP